jgi:hypothetical protein
MGEIFYSFDECFGRIEHFAATPVPLCAGKGSPPVFKLPLN